MDVDFISNLALQYCYLLSTELRSVDADVDSLSTYSSRQDDGHSGLRRKIESLRFVAKLTMYTSTPYLDHSATV